MPRPAIQHPEIQRPEIPNLEIHGHRGARGLFPENTLEGFAATLELGVDALELDVGLTRDGVVVVHHDAALNPDLARGADGTWLRGTRPLIRDLSFAELRAFDVGRARPGSDLAARFPDQRPFDGARIPSLAEVLDALPGARLTVEIKCDPDRTAPPAALADAVAQLLAARGAAGRVLVESFDWRCIRRLRAHWPALALACLSEGGTPSVARQVGDEGVGTWTPAYTALTPDALSEARALGLRVIPWTVNCAADIRRLIAWGVDGITTDRPDLALHLRNG